MLISYKGVSKVEQTDNTLTADNINEIRLLLLLVTACKGVSKVQQADNTLTVNNMNKI